MDFSFDADQEALRTLAQKALATGDAWTELERAGLLGVMLPVERGGAGLGIVELGLVCEQLGRAAGPIEIVHALVAQAALARFDAGAAPARATLALHEAGAPVILARAPERKGGWRLDGVKVAVPGLDVATVVIAPARLASGARLLVRVAADARGVTKLAGTATDGATVHQLALDGVVVPDEALLARERADEALRWIERHLSVALSGYELGVAARQLEMTAEHVVRRQQFGKPIGLFQAVGQRCADMHVDVEALRLATWEAAYLCAGSYGDPIVWGSHSMGIPYDGDALDASVATAAFFAAEAGARVAAAAQHLHGGIGFDRAYPLYRYFLAAKRVELELGGATQQLARLGRVLAATPHDEAHPGARQ